MKNIFLIVVCFGLVKCARTELNTYSPRHGTPSFQVKANLSFMEPVFPYNDTILVEWGEIEKKFTGKEKLDLFNRVEDAVSKDLQNPWMYHKDEVPNWANNIHVLDLNNDDIDDFVYDGPYGPEDEIQFFIQKNGKFIRDARYYLQRDDKFDGVVSLEFDDSIGLKKIYYRDANHYGPSSGLTFADYFHEVQFAERSKSKSSSKSYTRVNCTDLPTQINLNNKVESRTDSIPIYFSLSREICEGVQARDSVIGYFRFDSKGRVISSKKDGVGHDWYCGEFELNFPMFGKQTLLGWVRAGEVKLN
jgi:hypothetical protein